MSRVAKLVVYLRSLSIYLSILALSHQLWAKRLDRSLLPVCSRSIRADPFSVLSHRASCVSSSLYLACRGFNKSCRAWRKWLSKESCENVRLTGLKRLNEASKGLYLRVSFIKESNRIETKPNFVYVVLVEVCCCHLAITISLPTHDDTLRRNLMWSCVTQINFVEWIPSWFTCKLVCKDPGSESFEKRLEAQVIRLATTTVVIYGLPFQIVWFRFISLI